MRGFAPGRHEHTGGQVTFVGTGINKALWLPPPSEPFCNSLVQALIYTGFTPEYGYFFASAEIQIQASVSAQSVRGPVVILGKRICTVQEYRMPL